MQNVLSTVLLSKCSETVKNLTAGLGVEPTTPC